MTKFSKSHLWINTYKKTCHIDFKIAHQNTHHHHPVLITIRAILVSNALGNCHRIKKYSLLTNTRSRILTFKTIAYKTKAELKRLLNKPRKSHKLVYSLSPIIIAITQAQLVKNISFHSKEERDHIRLIKILEARAPSTMIR